jgi:prevent-host-death family protein
MKLNVRETRERLSRLLDAVAAGEEVTITRRGRVAAKLVGVGEGQVRFPDRSALRAALPPMKEGAAETIRALRDEERY